MNETITPIKAALVLEIPSENTINEIASVNEIIEYLSDGNVAETNLFLL